MTLEEIKVLLEIEKFHPIFNKCSLITKINLLKMRDFYSTFFNIPSKEIYSNVSYVKFFVKYHNSKAKFDINNIKLDIINKVPIVNIILKYHEPIEVIEDIKININKTDMFIINNKIYTTNDLVTTLNFNVGMIDKNLIIQNLSLLDKFKEHGSKTTIKFWLGSDIKNNLNKIIKRTKGNDTNDIIRLVDFSKKLGLPRAMVNDRVKKGYKIFGVKLKYSCEGYGLNVYFFKSDLKKALKNKKYYIDLAECKDLIKEIKSLEEGKRLLFSYYKVLYNKNVNMGNNYIKKSTLKNYLFIFNLAKESYAKYFDYFYNSILENKECVYDLRLVLFSVYSKNKYEKYKKLYGDIIDKNITLKILNEIRSVSTKYKKSKQQGELNG